VVLDRWASDEVLRRARLRWSLDRASDLLEEAAECFVCMHGFWFCLFVKGE
jgi:hypothetical protein